MQKHYEEKQELKDNNQQSVISRLRRVSYEWLKNIPHVLYRDVLSQYLNYRDLIQLSLFFEQDVNINVFNYDFWRRRVKDQYERLLKTLPERKDEGSQKIYELFEEKRYREVYWALQTMKIKPINIQKESILNLLTDDPENVQEANRNQLNNFLSEITHFGSYNRQIGDQGASKIAESLKVNKTLTSLIFSASQISDEGALSLAESFKVNENLTSINLCFNQIGAQGASNLAESLKINTILTNLILVGNPIGDEGASSLAESLKVNATLTNLNLSSNQIGAQGASNLAESLKINTVLINLILAGNSIGDEEMLRLAESFKINESLTRIHLSNNQIGAQGASNLADCLKVNATLTSLHLYNNRIGDQGASSLADSLKINTTLISLDLSNNQIGAQGASNLADSLKVNKTLTSLNLSDNQIGNQQMMQKITDLIKRNVGFHDQCINALKQGELQCAVQLFKQGVSLNGVLSELIKDKHCQLKTIRTLLQIIQDNHLSITRGAVVETIDQVKDKHHPEIVAFLESWLSKFSVHQVVQEEKIEQQPKVQEDKPYSTARCIM